MPGNPNCYTRGDHTCWSGRLNSVKNIRECVRSYNQDSLSCLAARTRFCKIHGTSACADGTRICDNDTCSASSGAGTANAGNIQIYANDEGQGLDHLLDTLSKRDTKTVNVNLGQGVQSASDLPLIESSADSKKKEGNKFVVPLVIGAAAIVGLFFFTHREIMSRKHSRRRR